MSRFPARARVLKIRGRWYVIYPGGRKRTFSTWSRAMWHACEAVAKEHEYDIAMLRARAVDWS